MNNLKQTAFEWRSKQIRLRDALAFCEQLDIDVYDFNFWYELPVKCCTCDCVMPAGKMHCGHFLGRQNGGGSGVYFHPKNLHTQCPQCNIDLRGNTKVYQEFLEKKYGKDIIPVLLMLHREGSKYSKNELRRLVDKFKNAFETLKNGIWP